MAKGQAFKPSQYGFREGTRSPKMQEEPSKAPRASLSPEQSAYAEQLMNRVLLETVIDNMLIRIKHDVELKLIMGVADPLELPRRIKQEINNLFPKL